jgi:Zn-dependent peptidase ImmA (M78 family)
MINDSRLDFISYKVNSLRKTLSIDKYPIIMQDLLLEKFKSRFILRYLDLSYNIDAVSEYYFEKNICLVIINSNKVKPNLMKRLNFSLAHELGHYTLEHFNEFKGELSDKRKLELEAEADEFAGLFLVNRYKLLKLWRQKNEFLSDYFFVSQDVINICRENLRRTSKGDISRRLMKL